MDGRVTLTLPNGVPEQEALDFARSKESWIRGHLNTQPEICVPKIGGHIPVEGQMLRIIPANGRRVSVSGDQIAVPEQSTTTRLQSWLRDLARDRLAAASDLYADRLGRSYQRITLRDTRSRWGSCSSQGALMFSWRLIMAPPSVLAYVAAHEVAHLAEMNHSQAFWSQVERIHGSYDAERRWLRENGTQLHRYQFPR